MSIELGGMAIGWREAAMGAVIGLILLVGLYILVVLLRMRRLRKHPGVPPEAGTPPAPGAEASEPPEPQIPAVAADTGWQYAQSHLAQDAFMHGVEGELAQLRDEVDALRAEVAALRNELRQEIEQMHDQVHSHLRANQSVSPIYADAMQMAQFGHDAATIAERCGIARAEAELVLALVKSQNR